MSHTRQQYSPTPLAAQMLWESIFKTALNIVNALSRCFFICLCIYLSFYLSINLSIHPTHLLLIPHRVVDGVEPDVAQGHHRVGVVVRGGCLEDLIGVWENLKNISQHKRMMIKSKKLIK